MKSRLCIVFIMMFSFSLIFQQNAFARVAVAPKVTVGNLLYPGAINTIPSELESNDFRAYLNYYQSNGTSEYEDDSKFSDNSTTMMIGGDIGVGAGQLSIGYSNYKNTFDSESLSAYWEAVGRNLKWETTISRLDLGYVFTGVEKLTAGILISNINYNVEKTDSLASGYYWTSTGNSTDKGSASVTYIEYDITASYEISDSFTAGLSYTPSVNQNTNYGGDFSSTKRFIGHGAYYKLGAGYTTDRLALEFDLAIEAEQKDTADNKTTTIALLSEYLVGHDFSLLAEYAITQIDKLTKGDYTYPEGDRSYWEIGARFKKSRMSFYGAYSVQQLKYNDDDPDVDNLDTASSSRIYLSFCLSF